MLISKEDAIKEQNRNFEMVDKGLNHFGKIFTGYNFGVYLFHDGLPNGEIEDITLSIKNVIASFSEATGKRPNYTINKLKIGGINYPDSKFSAIPLTDALTGEEATLSTLNFFLTTSCLYNKEIIGVNTAHLLLYSLFANGKEGQQQKFLADASGLKFGGSENSLATFREEESFLGDLVHNFSTPDQPATEERIAAILNRTYENSLEMLLKEVKKEMALLG